jgi:hypothetical protein
MNELMVDKNNLWRTNPIEEPFTGAASNGFIRSTLNSKTFDNIKDYYSWYQSESKIFNRFMSTNLIKEFGWL